MKSFIAKKETTEPNWLLIDADEQVVGRLAVRLATMLMGKHKPTYTPHVDCGDMLVVINADKVRFGDKRVEHSQIANYSKKMAKKTYQNWSGYPGGLKVQTGEQLMVKHPEEVLRLAVRRMLPKSRLGRAMLKKLRLFKGTSHPHTAQQPTPTKV